MKNEFSERMAEAHSYFLWKSKAKSLSQEALAVLVGERLGRSLTQSAVGRWFRGSVPDTATISAIASVYGVDPGWLAFGDLSEAPPPGDPEPLPKRVGSRRPVKTSDEE